jgi:hypothetical protein
VACILELARGNPRRRKEIIDAGFVGTLRHICEFGSHVGAGLGGGSSSNSGGNGSGTGGIVGMGGRNVVSGMIEDDSRVIDRARVALDWLEHGDGYIL